MKVRRYRDGRLVYARRLRRATLQSERNLALQRLQGMLTALDKFTAMVEELRALGQTPATPEMVGTRAAGCSAAADDDGAETDTRERASTCGMQAFDEASVGGQMLPSGSDTTTHS